MNTKATVEPRTAGIVIGGIIALSVIIGILSSGGGDDDSASIDLPLDTTTTTAAASTTAVPADGDHPDVESIDCNLLLTQDERDDALGTWERDDIPASLHFSRGEFCSEEFDGEPEFFVRIEPGEPEDFLPGTQIDGVTGVEVAGVGDAARWYDSEAGTLSVGVESELGILIYRIVLGRPDVTSEERLEIAKTLAGHALSRFPGVEPPPPPEPEITTFEAPPVDLPPNTWVGQILAAEESGEMTRGEAIVQTLRVFLGELNPEEGPGGGAPADWSSSRVIAMARDYTMTGPDDEVRAEVGALLDRLLPPLDDLRAVTAVPDPEPEGADGGDGGDGEESAAVFAPRPMLARSPLAAIAPAQDDQPVPDYCEQFGVAPPCLVEIQVPALEQQWPGKYSVIRPTSEVFDGWDTPTIDLVLAALAESVTKYEAYGESEMPPTTLLLSTFANNPTAVHTEFHGGQDCTVGVWPQGPNTSDAARYQQLIATAIAQCLIANTFRDQNPLEFNQTQWWSDALAVVLSDTVYPLAGKESELAPRLRDVDLQLTLLQRRYENWAYFELLTQQMSVENVFVAVRGLDASLDGVFADFWHDFNVDLSDGIIHDASGTGPAFVPRKEEVVITGPITFDLTPSRFFSARGHMSVANGQKACAEYDLTGDIVATWRPGDVGPPAGGWSEDLPVEFSGGDILILVTATADDADFVMRVTRVVDVDDECEEEDETDEGDAGADASGGGSGEAEPPGVCQLECEPSDYYWIGRPSW